MTSSLANDLIERELPRYDWESTQGSNINESAEENERMWIGRPLLLRSGEAEGNESSDYG